MEDVERHGSRPELKLPVPPEGLRATSARPAGHSGQGPPQHKDPGTARSTAHPASEVEHERPNISPPWRFYTLVSGIALVCCVILLVHKSFLPAMDAGEVAAREDEERSTVPAEMGEEWLIFHNLEPTRPSTKRRGVNSDASNATGEHAVEVDTESTSRTEKLPTLLKGIREAALNSTMQGLQTSNEDEP